jgi:hypothetical protein
MSRYKPLVPLAILGSLALPHYAFADSLSSDMALPADDVPRTVIELPSVWLNAGEGRYLWSFFKMTGPSGTNTNYIFAGQITCSGPATDPNGAFSTQNWRGYDQDPGGITQSIHFLLVAPVAGSYTCSLKVHAGTNSPPSPPPVMTVKAGIDTTYLRMSSGPEPQPAQWATRSPNYTEFNVGESAHVLAQTFVASSSSTNIVAISDLEFTTCYVGTASCASHWGQPGVDGTTVETRLKVAQLDASGAPCGSWYLHPASGSRVTYIDNATHHRKVSHSLTVPRSTSGTCTNRFAIKTYLHVVSGNPLRLEHDTGTKLYSNGIALNR